MSTATAGPSTTLSESSKRTFARLAGMSTLIIASVAMLLVGILIGSAATMARSASLTLSC